MLNDNLLVSVIVPIYKVEKYIDRCIKSIVNQTYHNIEIILVDDGSPDNCPTICNNWEKKDSRIKVIHKLNGGLSDARNLGLNMANGAYISFVDSDDFVAPDFIETMITDIKNYNAQIACIGYLEFQDTKDIITETNENTITEYDHFNAIKELFSSDTFCNYAWNKLYLKELFNNITFPIGKKMEDLGTTYLLMEKCERITYNTKKLYYYYQRNDSLLHRIDNQFYIDKFKLSVNRYIHLKNIFGDFSENIEFITFVIFQCYPYIKINPDDKKLAQDEMKYIWKINKGKYSIKQKIKYLLFQYNTPLYCTLFKK